MGQSTIVVGATRARLSGPPEVVRAAVAAMTVKDPAADRTWRFKNGKWDGTVCLIQPGPSGAVFPAGFTWRVANSVKLAGLPKPAIVWPSLAERPPLAAALRGIDFAPHQLDAVEKLSRVKRCALECATRGGKTEIGVEFMRRAGGRALWLTHLRGLAEQSAGRIADRLQIEVGVAEKGDDPGTPVVVGMVQTLGRLAAEDPGWFRRFDVVVADEAHHAGAPSWQAVLDACDNAYWRLGLSGTMRTGNLLHDLRLEGAIGPTFTVATTSDLVEVGFVARPRVVVLRVPVTSYATYESVRDDVCPGWQRDPQGVIGRAGHKLFAETYRRNVEQNDLRNRRILDVAASHAESGDRFLVLCGRVSHAKGLGVALSRRTKKPVYVLDGGVDGDERERQLAAFKAAESGAVLIATPFFREGFDAPQIDAGMLAGAGKSDVAVWQGLSRMLTKRFGKDEVLIYDFADAGTSRNAEKDYLSVQFASRRALYQRQGCAIEYR